MIKVMVQLIVLYHLPVT